MFRSCIALGLGAIALASCATYRPQPADLAEHHRLWLMRNAESAEVTDFARQLQAGSAVPIEFNPADGIALREAEIIGLFYNRDLRLARAELEVSRADARFAGLWPDPQINVGVLRLIESAAEPWTVAVDAALTLPILGGPKIEKTRTDAIARSKLWRVATKELDWLHNLRRTWIELAAFSDQAALTRDQLAQLEEILDVAETLSRADEIRRAEARLFSIERVSLELDLHHFTHEAEHSETQVKLLLGLRPESDIAFQASLADVEFDASENIDLRERRLRDEHPALFALEAEYEASEEKLKLETRNAFPAISAGPSFERDEGDEKAGGNAALTLPLWNRNRREIAKAEAARDAARIAYEGEYERLVGELALAEQRLEAAQLDYQLLSTELIPLVDEQLEEARALARLGDFDPLLMLEALQRARETKLRLIEAHVEVLKAGEELSHLSPVEFLPTITRTHADKAEVMPHD